jgi:hypothetical protein
MRSLNSRLALLAGMGLLAGAFLLVPQVASASASHSKPYASARVKSLGQQPGSVGARRLPQELSSGDPTKSVAPRLSLPGCSRQDGYNGNVQWVNDGVYSTITTWGQVWDVCGTTAYVYLSWNSPTHHNTQVGHAPPFTTQGVNSPVFSIYANPSNIAVTVCANWQGQWRCGASSHV